ncbi:MAG TPA: UrcA family protein [Steroidobacteraceae bacterium]
MTRLATTMLLFGGLAGLATAGTAGALTAALDTPSMVVQFNADALATDSGTRALYRRLAQAAEQVCPNPTDTRLVRPAVLQCRQEALDAAVSKIHSQRLAALHASRTKSAG